MASEKNQKQLIKEMNRAKNEMQKIESQLRKLKRGPASTPGTGLSKGQRQRRNRAARNQGPSTSSPLPKGLPVLPKGLPVPYAQTARTFISQDEVVQNIKSSDDFRIKSLSINPGQADTFPWLSTIAKNWEKYEFKKLVFYFRSTVSGFADAGRQGKVLLSIDYDSTDSPPTNSVMMEACKPSDYRLPSESFTLAPALQLMQPAPLFVRPGPVPGSADIKTYDCGQIHIATEGIGAIDVVVGQLRVAYEVYLSTPVLESASTLVPNFRTFTSYGSMFGLTSGDIPNINYAGGGTPANPWGPWGSTVDGLGQVIVPAGNYLVTLNSTFTSGGTFTYGEVELTPLWDKVAGSTADPLSFFIQDGATTGTNQVQLSGTWFFRTDGTTAPARFLAWKARVVGFGDAVIDIDTSVSVTSV